MLIRATQGKPCRSTRNYQEVEPQPGQGRPGAASPHDCSTEYCARSLNRFTQSAVDSTGQPREFDARRQQGAASLQQLFAFGIVHMDVKLENATLPRIRRHVSAGWWRSVCVFLHAMTSRNPVERPSLAELLQHPHLQPARHCVDSQVAPRCSNLQPAILSANASLLGVAAGAEESMLGDVNLEPECKHKAKAAVEHEETDGFVSRGARAGRRRIHSITTLNRATPRFDARSFYQLNSQNTIQTCEH